MTTTTTRPLPEALSRRDKPKTSGEWDVKECAPVRGLPQTSVNGRMMRSPMGSDPLSEVVRAHEMIHAKVSPNNWNEYLERGVASDEALRSVEELRVNYLATTLSYDMKQLMDGSEDKYGERCVETDDWSNAVLYAVAVAGTGGHKKFMNGVRRKNKVWGAVLADISKRALKEITRVPVRQLSSTELDSNNLAIGFSHVERVAEWVDRMADSPPKDETKDETKDDDTGGDDGGETDKTETKRGRPKGDDVDTTEAVSRSRGKPILSDSPPNWMKLKVEEVPLPEVLGGALGKKRIASQTGKFPRRLHRYLTDPQKRIFDRTVKGAGGIVVVDSSGSMCLTRDELRDIVMSAQGCTVMSYTVHDWEIDDKGEAVQPNAWVLAHKGRICEAMPYEHGRGNGVDLPALRWAVSKRTRSSTPIVWVSDGQVTGMYDNPHDGLTLQVIEYCRENNIVIAPNSTKACEYLSALGRGERVHMPQPYHYATTERKYVGRVA